MNPDAGVQTIVVVCGNFGEFKNYLASLKLKYSYAKGYAYHGGFRYRNCGDAQLLRGLKNWKPVFYGSWERRNDIEMINEFYKMDARRYPEPEEKKS